MTKFLASSLRLPSSAPQLFADPPEKDFHYYQHGLSIQHGWFPWVVEILAVLALAYSISGRGRTRQWWLRWTPVAVLLAVGMIGLVHWYIDNQGLADDPAPDVLWFWVGASTAAVAVLLLGWRGQWWGRRAVAVLAVPLCLLATGVVVNQWVGYFRTLQEGWSELTAGSLPGEVDAEDLPALQGTAQTAGRIVPVDPPNDASHFSHRTEYVYLPPAWFAAKPAPQLPVVMMIGGEFDTPAHWVRVGDATKVADEFAARHGGNAPILVFVDSGGSFNTDSECVNGPRGNSEDHLTKDVPPFVVAHFGASPDPAKWGVVGWSMGGTCAVDLASLHPELFSGFVDIAGDIAPGAGDKAKTIEHLYGGNAAAYDYYDPAQAMARHGRYAHTAGWFQASSTPLKLPPGFKVPQASDDDVTKSGFGGKDYDGFMGSGDYLGAAQQLCATGQQQGIDCTVITKSGRHTWQFASAAFRDALPWLAGYLQTPDVPAIPLPRPALPGS